MSNIRNNFLLSTLIFGLMSVFTFSSVYADRGAIFQITNNTGVPITYKISDVRDVKFHNNNQKSGTIENNKNRSMTVHVTDCNIFGKNCEGQFEISIQGNKSGQQFYNRAVIYFYKTDKHDTATLVCTNLNIKSHDRGMPIPTQNWRKLEIELVHPENAC